MKLKNYYESFVKTLWRLHFYFCFGLTFQLPSGIGQQIVFKTHFFFFFFHLHSFSFTFTIYLYFYLDFISSTYLPPLCLTSFQISKSKSYDLSPFSLPLVSHHVGTLSKTLWETVLRNNKDIKKRRRLEEHRREICWDQDTRERERFVEKLS